jgi:hypothetical protein
MADEFRLKQGAPGSQGFCAIDFNGLKQSDGGAYKLYIDSLYPVKSINLQKTPSIVQESDVHGSSDDVNATINFYSDGNDLFEGNLSFYLYNFETNWTKIWQWILCYPYLSPAGIWFSADGKYCNGFSNCFVTRASFGCNSLEGNDFATFDLSVIVQSSVDKTPDEIEIYNSSLDEGIGVRTNFEQYTNLWSSTNYQWNNQNYTITPWYQLLVDYYFGGYADTADILSFKINIETPWKAKYLLGEDVAGDATKTGGVKRPSYFKRGLASVNGSITLYDDNGIPEPTESERDGSFSVGLVRDEGFQIFTQSAVIIEYPKPSVSATNPVIRTLNWKVVPEPGSRILDYT